MKRGSETSATVGAAAQQVLPGGTARVGLRLSPPGAGRVTLSTKSGVTLDAGLTLTAGMQPVYICADCVGDLIGSQWHAIADAANRTIGLFEVYEV